MLSAWRSCFASPGHEMAKVAQQGGVQLAAWIEKHITDNAARNPLSYTLSPERAWLRTVPMPVTADCCLWLCVVHRAFLLASMR